MNFVCPPSLYNSCVPFSECFSNCTSDKLPCYKSMHCALCTNTDSGNTSGMLVTWLSCSDSFNFLGLAVSISVSSVV